MASVNIKARPCQIDVALVRRACGVVRHDAGLVFKRRDGIDVIDGGNGIIPRQSSVSGCADENAALSAPWSLHSDTVEREVGVIGDAVARKRHRIIALHQILWVLWRNRLPGHPAIHRHVSITCGARQRRTARLKRRADEVIWILRVDGDCNLSGLERVGFRNSDDTLSLRVR